MNAVRVRPLGARVGWLVRSYFALIILSKSLILFSFDAFVCLTSFIDKERKFSDNLISLMSVFKSSAWFLGGMMLMGDNVSRIDFFISNFTLQQ